MSFISGLLNLIPQGSNDTLPGDFPSQAINTATPGTQLLVSVVIGGVSLLLFSLLRLHWPTLYASRSRLLSSRPPYLGNRLLSWVLPLYRISDEEFLEQVGLDALMLLRFFKLGARLFGVSSIYGVCVLIPVTWTATEYDPSLGFDINKSWSISALGDRDGRLAAHCVGVYFITFLSLYLLNREYQIYSHLRWTFLRKKQHSVVARSVMIEGLDGPLNQPKLLQAYFEKLNVGQVEKVELVYDSPELTRMVRLRSNALRRVEEYVVAWLKNPCTDEKYDPIEVKDSITSGTIYTIPGKTRPTTRTGLLGLLGPRIDAIKHSYDCFISYDVAVKRLRVVDYPSSGVGFITFKLQQTAHVFSQLHTNSKPNSLEADLAPEPGNLFWINANLTGQERKFREVIVTIVMGFVMFFWGVPLSFVAPLLNLAQLVKTFPFLNSLASVNPMIWSLLSGFLPTVTAISFVALTPFVFTGLSILQGGKTHFAIEKLTVSKHFVFLLINVLLVFTVANSVWKQLLNQIVQSPTEIPAILARTLPDVAPFFVNYVMILGIGYFPFQLLQPGPVFYFVIRRIFCTTPRDFAELLAPTFTDYGWLYGQPMLVFVAVTLYSVVSPHILVVGTIYFVAGHGVMKYSLLYVFYRNYESGGLLWPMVFRRIMVGLFLLHITMAGYFALHELFSLTFAMVPLIVLTSLFVSYIPRAFPNGCKYLPVDFMTEDVLDKSNLTTEHSGPISKSSSARDLSVTHSSHSTIDIEGNGLHHFHHKHDDWAESQFAAEPNIHTEYQQSPMFRFNGVLDSSINHYGYPAIQGCLPKLWLPQKVQSTVYSKLKKFRTCFCYFPISLNPMTLYRSNSRSVNQHVQ